MSEVFILQNQEKLFLSKQKDWVDGRDLNSLFKAIYKDEAINHSVEISSKDYRQRIKIIACAINDKGFPVIADELLTESSPHTAQDLFEEQADADNLSLVTDQAALSDTEKEPSTEPHA